MTTKPSEDATSTTQNRDDEAAEPSDKESSTSAVDPPKREKDIKRVPEADPDAPGYSALGLQDGDPVEL
jgi:hypothetical protein